MSGVRHPTPTSGGTWKAPPVPTSTVRLLVNFAPEWHVAHPVAELSKRAFPRSAEAASTQDGAGGAATFWTQPVMAPISAVFSGAPSIRTVYTSLTSTFR